MISDFSWAVGIVEAEGWIGVVERENASPYPRVHVNMKDEDSIARLAAFWGSSYWKQSARHANWSDQYTTEISHANATRFLQDAYPHMGERRRQKIREVLGEVPIIGSTPLSEWLWFVGYMEGEGWFTLSGKVPRIGVKATDKDVVGRANNIIKATSLMYTSNSGKPNWKPAYTAASASLRAGRLMRRMLSHMSARRQSQINTVLETWRNNASNKYALTPFKVRQILAFFEAAPFKRGMDAQAGREFGVDKAMARRIRLGKAWKSIPRKEWQHVSIRPSEEGDQPRT